jgi:HEPN domain-containing protein
MPLTQADEAVAPSLAEMETVHQNMLAKANSFLEGALRFHEGSEYALAAFMLHQAMEHGINAILVPLMHFRMKTHNLHKLLRFLRRFSTDLYDIFPRDTEKELIMFRLLQRAYVHARYKDNYVVSAGDSEALTNRVSFFLAGVAVVFSTIKTNGKDG